MEHKEEGIRTRGEGMERLQVAAMTDIDGVTLWKKNLRQSESMEAGGFPERAGEPDCVYFIRTGHCKYGMTCRFNHPSDRMMVILFFHCPISFIIFIASRECKLLSLFYKSTVSFNDRASLLFSWIAHLPLVDGYCVLKRKKISPFYLKKFHSCNYNNFPIFHFNLNIYNLLLSISATNCLQFFPAVNFQNIAGTKIRGGYPERAGQPDCQYYLKTGTCKFGARCKFHHPKDHDGIFGRVELNILGYPLRPNDKECAYYLRTGECKFGSACKFHHPQPSNTMIPLHGSPVYPSVHSSAAYGQQSYPGTPANWSLSRAFIPHRRWQGASTYTPLILPQGLVQVSGWNTYTGQLGSVSSPEGQKQSPTTSAQRYYTPRQIEKNSGSHQAGFSLYRSSSVPTALYALPRESIFPERPEQPECQFYMKTGDCKFGTLCRFHHPRERFIPVPNCVLSPLGLPLRPGEPFCVFYSHYGICKFGPTCKFDHPMASLTCTISTSPAPGVVAAPPSFGSSARPPSLTLVSEGSVGSGSGTANPRRLSISEPRQTSSDEANMEIGGSNTNGEANSSFSKRPQVN